MRGQQTQFGFTLTAREPVVVEDSSAERRFRGSSLLAGHGVVSGVTVAELFAGVRTARDEARLQTALADFPAVPIPDAVWELTGRNQATLQANGVTVPLTDTVIATVAMAIGVELWTYDGHFQLIQRVLPALRLFVEPP